VVPFTIKHNKNCNQNHNHIHKWYSFRIKITIGLITTTWVVIEGNIVRSSPQMVLLGVLEELLKMAMYLEPVLHGRNSERLTFRQHLKTWAIQRIKIRFTLMVLRRFKIFKINR